MVGIIYGRYCLKNLGVKCTLKTFQEVCGVGWGGGGIHQCDCVAGVYVYVQPNNKWTKCVCGILNSDRSAALQRFTSWHCVL